MSLSNEELTSGEQDQELQFQSRKRKKTNDAASREIFPFKLYQLLQEEKQDCIVKWMGNGEFFKIFDKKRFFIDIVPKYFRRKLF